MSTDKYIEDLKALPEPRKTFMEIMKSHQSEVHMANVLAYFFRSNEKHGLGKVFFEALLETNSYVLAITKEKTEDVLYHHSWNYKDEKGTNFSLEKVNDIDIENLSQLGSVINAKTEEITNLTNEKKKRLDLIVTTDNCVLCIEFKINHELNNPLKTYQNQIQEIEKKFQTKGNKPRNLYFVVLTPFKKKPSDSVQHLINEGNNPFRQVILGHFIRKVIENIPNDYWKENASNPNAQYLSDLIQTIQNREVRFKRSEILKDLLNQLKPTYNCEYFSKGGAGGFIQINSKNSRYKIRFSDNCQVQLEKWSLDSKREMTYAPISLSCANDYRAQVDIFKQTIN